MVDPVFVASLRSFPKIGPSGLMGSTFFLLALAKRIYDFWIVKCLKLLR